MEYSRGREEGSEDCGQGSGGGPWRCQVRLFGLVAQAQLPFCRTSCSAPRPTPSPAHTLATTGPRKAATFGARKRPRLARLSAAPTPSTSPLVARAKRRVARAKRGKGARARRARAKRERLGCVADLVCLPSFLHLLRSDSRSTAPRLRGSTSTSTSTGPGNGSGTRKRQGKQQEEEEQRKRDWRGHGVPPKALCRRDSGRAACVLEEAQDRVAWAPD